VIDIAGEKVMFRGEKRAMDIDIALHHPCTAAPSQHAAQLMASLYFVISVSACSAIFGFPK
jgi:hypothetical protein